MASIDQRVVQMVFDKGNFESAVKSVTNTLDNLKKNLNLDKAKDAFQDLEASSKEVTLADLASSIDTISSRFSTMGVIGTTVLANLTNSAVQAGKTMLKNITSSLIEGGKRRALNLEQAKFQIEGLGKAWEVVKEDVDYAVDGTAYGLDVAAKAAGQLIASGVSTGKNLKNALRGVSGVAAMTSSSYEDIADVFITVAGNGRLMGSELTRLSARGINAASTVAKYLGVTEAEVRDMTSKGKIDFQTFANAMDSAFGEHAKKANDTFTGALSNMKSALSRIGAEFATPAYEHMRVVLNSLREVANGVKALIAPLVTTATNGMKIVADYLTWAFSKLTAALGSDGAKGAMEQLNRIVTAVGTTLWNLYRDIRNIVRPIGEAFVEAFGGTLLDVIARALEGIEQFTRSLAINERVQENLRKTFVGIFTILASVLDILANIVGTVAGGFSTVVVNVFMFLLDILLSITGFLGDVVLKIKDFITYLLELEPVKAIVKGVSDAFISIGKCIGDAFNALKDFINKAMDGTFEFILGLFDSAGEAFQNLGNWILTAYTNIVNFITMVSELPIVQGTLSRIADAFGKIYDKASRVATIVKNTVVKAFEKAKEVVLKFISVAKDFIGQFVDISSIGEAFSNFKTFVSDAFKGSQDLFEFTAKLVGKVVEKFKELTGVGFEKFTTNLGKLRDKIVEVISAFNTMSGIKDFFKNLGNSFVNFANDTGGFIQKVKDNIAKFIEWVKEKISGITLGEVIAAGAAGSMIVFFMSLASTLNKIKPIAEAWSSFITEFGKIPKNLNKVLTSFADRIAVDKVKERIVAISQLVQSVALLAVALMLLANVDPGRLITAGAVLGGLIVLLGALAAVMGSKLITNTAGITAIGPSMLALAGSMVILAVALRIIAKLKVEDLAKGLIAIAIAVGELVAASIILTKFGGAGLSEGIGTIVALAGAMLMLSGAIALLSIIPKENLVKAATVLSALLFVMSTAAVVAGKADKGSVSTLIGLAASMLILAASIKILAMMDSDTMSTGLRRMAMMFIVMGGMFLAARLAGQYGKSAASAILAMSVSFILLAAAFKALSKITSQDITKGLATLASLMLIFAAMSAITRLAGKNGKSASIAIIAMSASLILIAGAIAILAQIDPDGLKRATLAIDSVIAMFAILVASSGLVKNSTKTVIQLGIVLGILSGALILLSLVEPDNLTAATIALDSVMAMLSILIASSSIIKKANAQVVLLGAVVAGIGALMGVLASENPEGQIKVAESLVILMTGLSAAMLACAAAGNLGSAAYKGIGVMAAVFGAIVALISIIGGINAATNGEFKTFLEETVPVLEAIGEAIGSFYGGIVSGFLSSAGGGLEQLGRDLNAFMDQFVTFAANAKTIDESALSGINSMIMMVLALGAADFMNAITNLITLGEGGSSLDKLSGQLPAFGRSLAAFAEALGDTNTENLAKAAKAGESLAKMAAAMPKEGGWLDNLFGTTDMSKFGSQLVDFGKALKDFGVAVNGTNYEAINSAIEPTQALVDLSNSIPTSGGYWQEWFGSQDFGTFGENLVEYGNAIKNFGNVLGTGVNYDAISKVMDPTKQLIEIANTIENSGGFVSWFMGDNSFGTFGDNLSSFGEGFQEFSESISNVEESSLEKMPAVIDLIESLAEVSKNLPETGGFLSLIFGDEELAAFAKQLPALGKGITDFANELGDTDPSIIEKALPAVIALGEMGDHLPKLGGLLGILTGGTFDMFLLGVQLPFLGFGIKSYSQAVDGISVSAVQESVPAVAAISEAVEKMPGIFSVLETLVASAIGIFAFPIMAASVARGIRAFSVNLKDVDVSSAEQGAKAAKALGDAIAAMPGVFDVLQNIVADLTGNNFTDCCRKLAEGIAVFSEGMEDVKILNVNTGIQAVNAIRGLAEQSGSFEALGGLGDKLKEFGEKFREFYNKVSDGVDTGNLEQLSSYLTELGNILKEFSSENGDILEFGNKFVETANKMVTEFIAVFQDNTTSVHDAAYEMVNQINVAGDEALTQANEKFSLAGQELVTALTNGINEGGEGVTQACTYIMQGALDSVKSKEPDFLQSGTSLMDHLGDGMLAAKSGVIKNVETIIKAAHDKVDSYKSKFETLGGKMMSSLASGISKAAGRVTSAAQSAINTAANNVSTSRFYEIGQNCATGLANGLSSRIASVRAAASALSRVAAAATAKAAEVESPSRVFMRIGAFMTQGLANGLISISNRVEKNATKVALQAVDAMAIVADTIEENIDNMVYEPKITPVVDYSQLGSGINGINGMFGSSYGLNMANRAFGQMNANSALYWQNQNGINDMTEMLNEKVSDLTEAVYGLYELNPEFTMYIDGKQFASTTARSMNRALGSISKRGGIS